MPNEKSNLFFRKYFFLINLFNYITQTNKNVFKEEKYLDIYLTNVSRSFQIISNFIKRHKHAYINYFK